MNYTTISPIYCFFFCKNANKFGTQAVYTVEKLKHTEYHNTRARAKWISRTKRGTKVNETTYIDVFFKETSIVYAS